MLISDPWFYVAAIPAVLLVGLSKSGFASGFGALGVPLLSLAVPVPQAAAIMLPLLLIMDGIGIQQLWRERDLELIRLLVPAGLIGTIVGALLFHTLSQPVVTGVVGTLTLLFLLQRLAFPPRSDSPAPPKSVGFALGIASGFTSFVAHAGGPPFSFYVLPLKLTPVRFTATMAVFFGIVNLSKWVPYAWLGLLDGRNFATSLILIPIAPFGVWMGIWLARHINSKLFYRFAYLGMFLTGVKLLWDAGGFSG